MNTEWYSKDNQVTCTADSKIQLLLIRMGWHGISAKQWSRAKNKVSAKDVVKPQTHQEHPQP